MKTFWDLPGGLFVWLISLHESLLFFIGLVVFRYHKSMEPLVFKQETSFLSLPLGITYTLILLLSGWAIAEAQAHYKGFAQKKGQLYHLFGLLLGGLFLGMKGFDFIDKIAKGKSFGDSSFWALYWFLNGFHFIHVLIGTFFLLSLFLKLRASIKVSASLTSEVSSIGTSKGSDLETFESVSVFWHACDLIWILVFSSLFVGN